MIFPDFCRILNLSFWFRRIFGFADYTQGYCFDDFGNTFPVAGCNVDDDNVAVESGDMAAVGHLIVKIVDCEIVAVGR